MMSLEKLQSFPKTQKARDLCVCEKPAPPFLGDIIDTATCTNSKESLISCEKEKNLKPVQKDICYERQNRRKRSARHSFTFIPPLVKRPIWKRSKVLLCFTITKNKYLYIVCIGIWLLNKTHLSYYINKRAMS